MPASKISVWWDIENCPVPRNVDPHKIAQNLSSTLHHGNLNGPVTIDAFGDTKVLKEDVLEALSSTGININHVPSGNKDAADKAILVAMLFWALDNPPPAHFLLISGDGDFANALHRLRMKQYNILLVRPDQHVKPALLGAATSVWYWTSVAEGRLSAFEHVGKMEEPLLKSTFMKKQSSSLHHQRSEEALFKSTSTKKQLLDDGLHSQRSEPIPSKRSSGSVPQLAVSRDSDIHNTQYQGLNDSSLSHSLPQCPESAAEVSSSVMNLNKLNDPDERRQVSKFGANLSEGTVVQLVEDRRSNKPLHARAIQKNSIELGVNKSELHPESFPFRMPFSGDDVATVPPVPINTQPCDPVDMQPSFSDSLSRSPCRSFSSSDAIADFVHNEGPISNPITKRLPFYGPENPPGLAREMLDTYRSSLNKVREALKTLKHEGLLPTEANLQDCMCYWNKEHDKVKIRQTLDKAIELQEITLMNVGLGGLRIFLPLNTCLWYCVNTEDMLYEYPYDIWMDFSHFLHCMETRQSFIKSQSKYEAAQILKNIGPVKIRRLSIGQIIHILHQSIQKKRWLRFHGMVSCPLSVDLQAVTHYLGSLPNSKLGPQPGIWNNDIETLADNSHQQGATAVSPPVHLSRKMIIFRELKIWLVKTLQGKSDYDVSLVRKDFEQATGIHLDHKDFGYSRFKDLIQEFSDVVSIKSVRKGLDILCPVAQGGSFEPVSSKSTVVDKKSSTVYSAHTMVNKRPVSTFKQSAFVQEPPIKKKLATLKNLKSWLTQLPSLNGGYDISSIKKDFLQETGITLDPKSLGYASMKDLINEFSDQICIENPRKGLLLLFPVKKSHVSQAFHRVKVGARMPLNGDDDIHRLEQGGIRDNFNSDGMSKQLPDDISKSFPLVQTTNSVQKGKVCQDAYVYPELELSEGTVNMRMHTTGGVHQGKVWQDLHIHTESECSEDTVNSVSMQVQENATAGLEQGIVCRASEESNEKIHSANSIPKELPDEFFHFYSPPSKETGLPEVPLHLAFDVHGFVENSSKAAAHVESTSKQAPDNLSQYSASLNKAAGAQHGEVYQVTDIDRSVQKGSGGEIRIGENTPNFVPEHLSTFSSVSTTASVRQSIAPGSFEYRKRMLEDTGKLLLEVVPEHKDGYPLARLKLDFKHRFGYDLDQVLAGFSKVGDIVRNFEFVSIEASPKGPHKVLQLRKS